MEGRGKRRRDLGETDRRDDVWGRGPCEHGRGRAGEGSGLVWGNEDRSADRPGEDRCGQPSWECNVAGEHEWHDRQDGWKPAGGQAGYRNDGTDSDGSSEGTRRGRDRIQGDADSDRGRDRRGIQSAGGRSVWALHAEPEHGSEREVWEGR